MVQIVATLASLLIGISALAVIVLSLAEEWDAVKRALLRPAHSTTPPLPPRTRMLAPARRARMMRVTPEASSLRAAA
jgi:hypothetical protein